MLSTEELFKTVQEIPRKTPKTESFFSVKWKTKELLLTNNFLNFIPDDGDLLGM